MTSKANQKDEWWVVDSHIKVAIFFGVTNDTIRKSWVPKGMPGTRRRYDLREIYQWNVKWIEKRLSRRGEDDEMLSGDSSPELERYRAARASIEEIKLERERGNTIDRARARIGLGRIADLLRGVGDVLQRQFGLEAHRLLDDALIEVERNADEIFGEHDGTDVEDEDGPEVDN